MDKVRAILIVNIFLWFEVTFFLSFFLQIQKLIFPFQNDVPFDTLLVLAWSIKTLESLSVIVIIANFLGATKSDKQDRLTINQLKFY